jgi:hypothetical protein
MIETSQESHVDQQDEVDNEDGYDGLFNRAIKFKSGEEIICGLQGEDINYTVKKYITVYNPMQVGKGVVLTDWSEVCSDDVIEISTDMIRSMYRIKDSVENHYMEVLHERYLINLKQLLEDENLTDEERHEIEAELLNSYDGSAEIQEMMDHEVIEKPKYLH